MHCLADSLVAGAHHSSLMKIVITEAITAITELWLIMGDNAADMLLWWVGHASCGGWVIASWQIIGKCN
jgi:hypothetical protein